MSRSSIHHATADTDGMIRAAAAGDLEGLTQVVAGMSPEEKDLALLSLSLRCAGIHPENIG